MNDTTREGDPEQVQNKMTKLMTMAIWTIGHANICLMVLPNQNKFVWATIPSA
jgi:hypothetical protein